MKRSIRKPSQVTSCLVISLNLFPKGICESVIIRKDLSQQLRFKYRSVVSVVTPSVRIKALFKLETSAPSQPVSGTRAFSRQSCEACLPTKGILRLKTTMNRSVWTSLFSQDLRPYRFSNQVEKKLNILLWDMSRNNAPYSAKQEHKWIIRSFHMSHLTNFHLINLVTGDFGFITKLKTRIVVFWDRFTFGVKFNRTIFFPTVRSVFTQVRTGEPNMVSCMYVSIYVYKIFRARQPKTV